MVKEIEELKESAEDFAKDLAEVSGGIFDEDLGEVDEEEPVAGVFDEDFEEIDEEAPASDFDIGSTLLTASAPVESWAGQNLEETLSRDWIKKDWDDDEDAFSGDFYKSSRDREDAYDAKGSDAYGATSRGRGDGVYNETSGAYDTKGKAYDVGGSELGALKSHEQIQDERRGGRGLLESSFSDRHKRENRVFNRDAIVYEGKDAA